MSLLVPSGIQFKDLPKTEWVNKRFLSHDSQVMIIIQLSTCGEYAEVKEDAVLNSAAFWVDKNEMHRFEYIID